MELTLTPDALPVLNALASPTRLAILTALAQRPQTITELGRALHYSKALISKQVKQLLAAGLVRQTPSADGREKRLQTVVDTLTLRLPERVYPEFRQVTTEIPLGNYFSYAAAPSCGLATTEAVIGRVDDPAVFMLPARSTASLLWFTAGRVEYRFPSAVAGHTVQLLDLAVELASEFPGANDNWPSAVTFWVNDVAVGTWTIPGNFADVRGKYTPSWWPDHASQYGLLKHLRITPSGTDLDGVALSPVTLTDLDLTDPVIRFALSTTGEPAHGLTLFGRGWGNYQQAIVATQYYSD